MYCNYIVQKSLWDSWLTCTVLLGDLDKKLVDHVTFWNSKERKWWYVYCNIIISKNTSGCILRGFCWRSSAWVSKASSVLPLTCNQCCALQWASNRPLRSGHIRRQVTATIPLWHACLMKNPCCCNRSHKFKFTGLVWICASGRSDTMTQTFPDADAVHTRRQVA